MNNVEYRNFNHLSDIRSNQDNESWTFDGYAVTWGTIDSYNSTFRKGAFKKTISERGDRIKVLWNHNSDEPIGKIVEIHEDKKGLFVKALLTEGVAKANDVYRNLLAGVINTLSFGFIPLQKKTTKDGVLEITEVKLFEVSPVTFEANETAVITDVRNDSEPVDDKMEDDVSEVENIIDEKVEADERSEDFSETINELEIGAKGYKLMDALTETLWDIWWNNDDKDVIIDKSDSAISEFNAEYLKWASAYMETFWEERKTAMSVNDLAKSFALEMRDSVEEMSSKTSFTVDELRCLVSGKILSKESRKKLVELPESIRSAHQDERCKAVETLCDELRDSGFSSAEKERFGALLGLTDERSSGDLGDAMKELMKIRNSIKE